MAKEILIAESDRMVQEEFEKFFEATDHHLFFTTNEEEALLRGRLFKPDLMIGGKDLCQAVRSDQDLKNIPFIILLDMFEDLSEKDCKRLKADGMISRPLNGDEIFSRVNPFIGGVQAEARDKVDLEGNMGWKSFGDIGKTETEKREEFSLDASGRIDEEEEIIELVDVVEEPESKMSIDDFAFLQKDEPIGEIAPIESWEKPEKEEVGMEKEFLLPPKEKEEVEEISLQLDEPTIEKKAIPGDKLFEKIELEDILQKMEKLQLSIEKEWPLEKEGKIPEAVPQKIEPPPQKAEEKFAGFDEFEAALKGEVKIESSEVELQPFFVEEVKQEAPKLETPTVELPPKEPPKEELPVELDLEELTEEEFPEIFLEELKDELEKLEEKELMSEATAVEVEEEPTEEEELSEFFGEELQPSKQALTEVVRVEEPSPMEELFPMEEFTPAPAEGIQPSKQAFTEVVRAEEPSPVEELFFMDEFPPAPAEKIVPVEEFKEAVVTPPESTEVPKVSLEEMPPPVIRLDRKIEEVITKGVEEMMQDIVTKVVPEMTRHMITSTMERIESMVKEVIPDLAEKAIQEEIKRLQKGDKD
ncbi:MAG: hypothetical protein FJ110_04750 [Deltaproteobacteria bacterium]|nr:hypothetical protein [Deltaproteobacteria bacterium]